MNIKSQSQRTIKAISLDNIKTKPQVRSLQNKGFEAQDGSEAYPNNAVLSDDSIEALASSIRSQGLQNPIIVRPAHIDDDYSKPVIEDCYIIVSGERRYRATLLIQKQQQAEIVAGTFNPKEKLVNTIDAIVKDYSHDSDIYADQLTENIQRVDLTGFEISDAIMKYKKSYEKENPNHPKLTTYNIAKTFGKGLYWVTQMTSFAKLDATDDKELISLFKEGVISSSPRMGYELIRLYLKDMQTTLEVLYKFKESGKVFDRSAIPNLKALIENKKNEDKQKESSRLLNELPGLSISSTEKIKNKPLTQEMNDRFNDEVLETNIKAIKVSILNNKEEENVCELSDTNKELQKVILDLILKLKNKKNIQVLLDQGFECNVSADQIRSISIKLN